MAAEIFDEWQPKVPMNGGQKFRQLAAKSSDEWRPKVPMNGGQKFRQMAVIIKDPIMTQSSSELNV